MSVDFAPTASWNFWLKMSSKIRCPGAPNTQLCSVAMLHLIRSSTPLSPVSNVAKPARAQTHHDIKKNKSRFRINMNEFVTFVKHCLRSMGPVFNFNTHSLHQITCQGPFPIIPICFYCFPSLTKQCFNEFAWHVHAQKSLQTCVCHHFCLGNV